MPRSQEEQRTGKARAYARIRKAARLSPIIVGNIVVTHELVPQGIRVRGTTTTGDPDNTLCDYLVPWTELEYAIPDPREAARERVRLQLRKPVEAVDAAG